MGCAQSRIDNEESVSRCKERRNLMKEAVVARNAFAAGHSGYTMALKNTGAALSDYALGESQQTQEQLLLHSQVPDAAASQAPPPLPPPLDNLPPPPPLPTFTPSPPIKRAASLPSMPTVVRKSRMQGVRLPSAEEDEEEEEDDHVHDHGHDRDEEEEEEEEKGFRRRRRSGAAEMKAAPAEAPMPESKGMAWDYFFMVDDMAGHRLNDEEEEGDEEFGDDSGHVDDEVEPKTPEKAAEIQEKPEPETPVMMTPETPATIDHAKSVPADFERRVMPGYTLMDVLSKVDDHFLKASECAKGVSGMLEATRLHYHSNFADNRGHIDHSQRVMRVITWNRSFRGIPNGDGAKDEDSDDFETHATVLDKLLAWEKKLYDEVKQGELMKVEYQRKVALLNKQKKRSASAETLEKTKAAVSHLHTRYIVDMQSMDSTVLEVNEIRDKQLYPKLVSLAEGMAKMWENMCTHHNSQLMSVMDLKALDISHIPMETTKQHHGRTVQLFNVVDQWHSEFDKLVTHQKQYIQALNNWLKLNLIPIESSLKEKVSSPPRVQRPPIQALLISWHDFLEKLPDEAPKSATSSFAATMQTIILHQEEEMKLKEQLEYTTKEYQRKKQGFEEWYQKYLERRGPGDVDQERSEDVNHKDPVAEKRFAVDSLKKRMDEEAEAYHKQCIQVREKSLGNLKTRLPELFRNMSEYAHACAEAYGKLTSMTLPQASSDNGNSHV